MANILLANVFAQVSIVNKFVPDLGDHWNLH